MDTYIHNQIKVQLKPKTIFVQASRSVYYYGSEVVGYLKQARNLDILLVK